MLSGLAILATASMAPGTVVVIPVDIEDAEVTAASVIKQREPGPILGGTVLKVGASAVFPFRLPLLAPGESITTANLDLSVAPTGAPAFNIDLYGLGHRFLPLVKTSDFYVGTFDDTDATLIRDDHAGPASPAGRAGTDAVGDASLAAYLQGQYALGGAGDFVFLRASPDFASNPGSSTSGTIGYQLPAYEAGEATRAVLTITTIPEPALLTPLAAGLLAISSRRSRRAGPSRA